MNRFLVFFGSNYYPNGGWSDFQGSFATLEGAKEYLIGGGFDWCHVIDSLDGSKVFEKNT